MHMEVRACSIAVVAGSCLYQESSGSFCDYSLQVLAKDVAEETTNATCSMTLTQQAPYPTNPLWN
jgi:hypothetical protein